MSRSSRSFLALAALAVWTAVSSEASPGLADGTLEGLLQEGSTHFRGRRYFQAIESFRNALELADGQQVTEVKKNLASAYGALGAEHFNAGETRLAGDNFRKGLEYADNYYSHFGLGYLYFLRMEEGEARKHLQAALRLRGDFPGTHKLLALLDYRQGRTAKALERMGEARRLDPKDAETLALERRWRVESSFSSSFAQFSTASFVCRVDPGIAAPARRRVLRELDRAHAGLGDALGVWPSRKLPVVLYTEKNFHSATGSYHWVGGMYDGQLKMPVPAGDLSEKDSLAGVRKVIRHEHAHALVRHVAPECPVWLNEGIAQHFEGPVDRGALERRLHDGRDRRLPFAQVPSRLWAVEDVDLARWSYLQGLGFVEHLVEHYHEFRLRLLVVALAEERSLGKAFERTYGQSLEELEEAWWREIQARGGTSGKRREGAGAAPGKPGALR